MYSESIRYLKMYYQSKQKRHYVLMSLLLYSTEHLSILQLLSEDDIFFPMLKIVTDTVDNVNKEQNLGLLSQC